MAKLALVLLVALIAVCSAQNDGRYQPFSFGKFLQPRPLVIGAGVSGSTSGSYRPSGDGRYTPDNSGSYRNNDGRYYPDNSGRYNPDGSGSYDGQNGKYNPDGTGGYTGQNEAYRQDKDKFVGGGQYTGNGFGSNAGGKGSPNAGSGSKGNPNAGFGNKGSSNSGAKPFGPGSGFGNGLGSGVGATNKVSKPVLVGTGIAAAAGFGKPVVIKKGDASGKYDNRNYAIIRQEGTLDQDGYHYLYETENGITGEEQGKLHFRGTEQEVMKANGFFTYTGPDSMVYTVTYTADENGFLPQGDHIPTPPPIPEYILRSLEYQRTHGSL